MSKRIVAIVLAGGISARMKGINKLLWKIENKTVIERSVDIFRSSFIDDIVVVSSDKSIRSLFLDVKFAQAGKTRQNSVLNALELLEDSDYAIIHDGARPFFNKEQLKELIEYSKENKNFIVGRFATDTIKIVKENKVIKTIDRDIVFKAQTPQGAEVGILKRAYRKNENFTDESSAIEKDYEVSIIESKSKNEKITFLEDLKCIE